MQTGHKTRVLPQPGETLFRGLTRPNVSSEVGSTSDDRILGFTVDRDEIRAVLIYSKMLDQLFKSVYERHCSMSSTR